MISHYCRTSKGHEELKKRSRRLTARQRALLLMIESLPLQTSSVASTLEQVATVDNLAHLVSLGLIQPLTNELQIEDELLLNQNQLKQDQFNQNQLSDKPVLAVKAFEVVPQQTAVTGHLSDVFSNQMNGNVNQQAHVIDTENSSVAIIIYKAILSPAQQCIPFTHPQYACVAIIKQEHDFNPSDNLASACESFADTAQLEAAIVDAPDHALKEPMPAALSALSDYEAAPEEASSRLDVSPTLLIGYKPNLMLTYRPSSTTSELLKRISDQPCEERAVLESQAMADTQQLIEPAAMELHESGMEATIASGLIAQESSVHEASAQDAPVLKVVSADKVLTKFAVTYAIPTGITGSLAPSSKLFQEFGHLLPISSVNNTDRDKSQDIPVLTLRVDMDIPKPAPILALSLFSMDELDQLMVAKPPYETVY